MTHADRLERIRNDMREVLRPGSDDALKAGAAALREVAELRARMEDARVMAETYVCDCPKLHPCDDEMCQLAQRILAAHPAPVGICSKHPGQEQCCHCSEPCGEWPNCAANAHPAPAPAPSKSQLKRLAAQKAPAPATCDGSGWIGCNCFVKKCECLTARCPGCPACRGGRG